MDLEGIMLCEVGQTKTKTTFHSYVGFKTQNKENKHRQKPRLLNTENRWLPEGRWVGNGEIDKGD